MTLHYDYIYNKYHGKTKKPQGIIHAVLLLVRCKGLEPLTYWFVASHSIQLS